MTYRNPSLSCVPSEYKFLTNQFPSHSAVRKYLFTINQVWTERRDSWGAVNFITGAGGFLQAVIYGYGGFRLQDSELAFNPTLPPEVTKMSIRLNFLGSCMDFVISERNLTITIVFAGPIAPPLEVSTGKGVQNLERFKPVTFSRGRGAVRMS